MHINPNWRILTIGDGDLSFSNALLQHYAPAQLTATIFDPLATLENKYGDDFYKKLLAHNCQVLTGFDITKPETWSEIKHHSFDLVIFQFPLVPGFTSKTEFNDKCAGIGINTLNRRLLRQFLINSSEQLLDPTGPQLCYITSKDVKPYSEWNIQHSLIRNTDIHFLGEMNFDIANFPGYRIRNVDRDKHVKDTKGITYVWSLRPANQLAQALSSQLTPSTILGDDCCHYCQAGPFTSDQHRESHESSRKHLRMQDFEQQWLADLQTA
ncbi:class I SAM-dependent methyltransferase [Moritella sp. F3]|uniref:class I SAM-dependent methyltransferase n=1 Tax=Moritella sp. F3 TaxID=2718882 RepID=UPI0018E14021|nr:class I SAM-dependent methyltransferase [Moritella sp. F3]GIC75701.1 hypothetical protein FMO001_04280 [Moritella sp. F1]GIC81851.1 hypothetical protein FMO003_21320 [Moritella sp. F3]